MDLAWLLRGVSSKPESQSRERDVEETIQGQGQQRCSPSQVEVGRSRLFHQSGDRFDDPVAQVMQIDITLCQNLLALSVLEFICRPAEV